MVRTETILIGLLLSGAVACTSIIGTRDLTLVESDSAASATSSNDRKPGVTDGSDAGNGSEGADANEGAEPAPPHAGDAGAGDADVSPGPNFAREAGATATATTTYTGFPASRLIDGDLQTSWYAAAGACTTAAAGFSCAGVSATITLRAARTVGRLVVHGNNDKFTNYDVVAGRWELLGSNNKVLSAVNVMLPAPSFDGTTVLPTAVTDVVAVRFVVVTGDAPDPGVGEIEIYAR